MLPPLASPLRLEPADDRLPLIASVSPEFEAGHPSSPRLAPNPGLGNRQTLRDFAGREETLGHAAVLSSPATKLCSA